MGGPIGPLRSEGGKMASDYIVVSCKRGNKQEINGVPLLVHGCPVDHFDPEVYNPVLSEFCRSAYVFFKVRKALVGLVKEITVGAETSKFARPKEFNFKEIGKHVDLQGLKKENNHNGAMPVLDLCNMATEDIFKTTTKKDVADLLATAGGTKTIGTGGDFATMALLFADFANFTSDFLGNQISDVTETAKSECNEALGGYTWELTQTKERYGNHLDGYLLTHNYNDRMLYVKLTGAGTVKWHDLRITSSAPGAGRSMITFVSAGTWNAEIYRNTIDGANGEIEAIRPGSATQTAKIWNNLVFDLAAAGYGIRAAGATNGSNRYENNSVDGGIGIDAGAGATGTYQNNVCVNGATNYQNHNAATGNNNAGDDASVANGNWGAGNGNQANITNANEFESQTKTETRFLRLLKAVQYARVVGVLAKNGVAPGLTENTADFTGFPRPHLGGNYSIGAFEYERRLGTRFRPFGGVR